MAGYIQDDISNNGPLVPLPKNLLLHKSWMGGKGGGNERMLRTMVILQDMSVVGLYIDIVWNHLFVSSS